MSETYVYTCVVKESCAPQYIIRGIMCKDVQRILEGVYFQKITAQLSCLLFSKDSRVIIEGREAWSRYLYYCVRYNIMMYFSYEYYMGNLFAALADGYRKWHDFNFPPTSWRIKGHDISIHQPGYDLSDLVCRVLEWCARKYGKKSMSGQP